MSRQPMGAAQGGLRDRVILAIREQGLDHNGFHPHGWRCEHPDRYPDYCDCVESMADAVIAVMTKSTEPYPGGEMTECFDARCGYDDEHDHGDQCTIDCPCGEGEMSADGEWLGPLADSEGQQA